MAQILLTLQVFIGIVIVMLIVVFQQGRGADAGASFGGGGGGSNSLFGSRGSASFLFKLTGGLALLFLINSLMLSILATQSISQRSIIDQFDLSSDSTAATTASSVSDLHEALEAKDSPIKVDDDVPQLPTQ